MSTDSALPPAAAVATGGVPPARWGFYGGAFDPPHLGHVAMAQALVRQFQLDRLVVMPTGQAWHKNRPLTPAAHRLAMAERAFAAVDRAVVRRDELDREGPSYTVDTLTELGREAPPNTRWFLLLGQDQWQRFTTWSRWALLARMATIVVAERPDPACAKAIFSLEFGSPALADVPPAQRLNWVPQPHSSTAIRQALGACPPQGSGGALHSVPGLPPEVARYISLHQLYLNPPESPSV